MKTVRAVLPVIIAVGGVLLAGTPAYASVKATWSKPTDNSVFTTSAPIDFLVNLDRGGTLVTNPDSAAVYLSITTPAPGSPTYRVDTSSDASDKDLSFHFTPTCDNTNPGSNCPSSGLPAYNGHYTAALSGAVTGAHTITLQVPPAAPGGVTATATGQHRVKVTWAANTEPDLTGYDVFTSDGQTVAANLPTSTLSYEFDLPDTGYGGDHSYVVRAHRLACGNCGSSDQIDSPMSAPATVTLTEPTASPDPSGGGGYDGSGSTGGDTSGGGSTGGGSYDGGNGKGNNGNGSGNGGNTSSGGTTSDGYNNGSNTGGSFSSGSKLDPATAAAQQRAAFGLTFKSFAPKLGAPKLPPLPKLAAPSEGALPWGTYDPLLDYGKKTVTQRDHVASGGVTSEIVDTVTSAFQGARLFRSLAIGLILLLAAAHLRVFLRTPPTA